MIHSYQLSKTIYNPTFFSWSMSQSHFIQLALAHSQNKPQVVHVNTITTRPETSIPKILPITLLPNSLAPVVLITQNQILFLSKSTLFSKIIHHICSAASCWQVHGRLLFSSSGLTRSDGIRAHSHAWKWDVRGEDWRGSSTSSWAECMNACAWLRFCHLCICVHVADRMFSDFLLITSRIFFILWTSCYSQIISASHQ